MALNEVIGGETSVEVVIDEGMERGGRERMIMVERKKIGNNLVFLS